MRLVIKVSISSYYHPTQTVIGAARVPLMETTRNILIAILTIIIVITAIPLFGYVNGRHTAFTCTGEAYTVHPGDTIYGIVVAHCEGNLENAIYQTVQLNGGALIHPGQIITLPRG